MFFIIQTAKGYRVPLSKQQQELYEIKNKQYKAKRRMQIKATVLLVCLLLVILLALVSKAQAKTYTFGIVPQQSATRLALQWSPLLDAVSETSGHLLEFKTAPSIPEFEKRLAEGQYDFAYMNPYHYQVYSEQTGYQAFAKSKDKKLSGIIVVRKESDTTISNVAQLNAQSLAFPAPRAFAASVVLRGYLAQQNIDFDPAYVGSHDSVYRAVAAGLYPAGGGIPRTFQSSAVKDQLKVLWTSPGFTPHALAAHPKVDEEVFNAVQQAFLDIGVKEEQQSLLKALNMKGFIAAEDSDWDDVRALGIGNTHH
ncbi:phosphate/phosphite/phosphonate ABC transporter substrate-binding protein [Agarivorans sp. Alg241-V36]|uniref:phosphate/phosphite/phosphonate ABC transporter substrate-binding protein n=1 Tax=Agarivorans sp. Alg241-V36 TaxID=2305992 RepID=UPI0013D81897|nr:phosphate/phosphite/phosphonate ABC transporter substrate-binding protein [Agarivorans sp. Alg241-V36]